MPHFGDWSWRHIRRILNSNGREWTPTGDHIIDAMDDLPAEGGTVWLPPVQYTIPEEIHVTKPNVAFIGPCKGNRPMLTLADDVDDDMFFFDNSGVYGLLQNLWLEGNKPNNILGNGVRTFAGAYDLNVVRCNIMNFRENGLYINTFGCYFEDVYSELHNGSGLEGVGCFQNTFVHCDFFGNIYDGVALRALAHRNWFYGCRFERNLRYGIRLHATGGVPSFNSFHGGAVWENQHHGIMLEGAQNNVIKVAEIHNNGQALNNTYDGIHLCSMAADHSIRNIIKAIQIISDHLTINHRHGYYEADANQDYNILSDLIADGAITEDILVQAANTITCDTHELNSANVNAAVIHDQTVGVH